MATRRIVQNIGWLTIDQLVRLVLGFFIASWVARYLGPHDYGLLNYATAFAGLFGFIASLGLDGITLRDLIEQPNTTGTTLGSVFVLRFAGSAFASAICVLCYLHYGSEESHELLLLVAMAAFTHIVSPANLVSVYFQSIEQQKYTVVANSVSTVLGLATRAILIVSGAALYTFGCVQLGQSILLSAILLFLFVKRAKVQGLGFSKSRCVELLRESWPQMLSALAISIYMRIDQVMLTSICGPDQSGIYSAAVRLSELWYFIPTLVVAAFFPHVLREKSRDPASFAVNMAKLFSLMSLLSVVLAMPLSLLSKVGVYYVYGNGYSGSAEVLSIHIWSSIFVFWGVAQEPWNVSEKLLKLSLFRTLVGAIINVLLNLVLLPRYGAVGAAWATVIAYSSATVWGNLALKRTRPVFWMQICSLSPWRMVASFKELKKYGTH